MMTMTDNKFPMFMSALSAVRRAQKDIKAGKSVLPAPNKWFAAFEGLSLDKVKVVILGQDPYPTKGKAVGRAFGLPKGWPKINSSIENIRDVVESTQGGKLDLTLESWQKQKVLLLNTRLTVIEGKPMSHAGIGWEEFVAEVLTYLNELSKPPVLMLWGAEAQKFEKYASNCIKFKTSHPCKFSAHRGFLKMDHFTEVNKCLVARGQTPIRWTKAGG